MQDMREALEKNNVPGEKYLLTTNFELFHKKNWSVLEQLSGSLGQGKRHKWAVGGL